MDRKEQKKNTQTECPDDDYAVYIPDGDRRAIERVIRNMEQAQQEFRKVAESLKRADN
ncbi:MAG: hypothetical protein LBS42_00035 [Tannerella sp.]|jgi:hypothetical protein|nr:hypothetical protein [Tannerella sp.]